MIPELTFRLATEDDLADIVRMLADDSLGAAREQTDVSATGSYIHAFRRIESDSNQELTVAQVNGRVVGTFHLTFIQYLTHQGGLRAQIEAVRVDSTYRGTGIGAQLLSYAIDRARQKGCYMVQLTTDKQRQRAIRFYETLGFVATHESMKLRL